jgi:hypothetical protein
MDDSRFKRFALDKRVSRAHGLAILAVMALALCLRLVNLPDNSTVPVFDDAGYLASGLVMLEGMPPGYKASPAATEIWYSWASAVIESFRSVGAAKAALGPEASMKTTPFVAVEYGLAKLYSDFGALARGYLIWSALLASVAAGFACWQGAVRGGKDNGIAMGLLYGGLIACAPGLIGMAASARPYSDAWCLAFIAMAIAAAADGRARVIGAGLALGLSLACRIDMLLVAPIVFWQFLDRPVDGKTVMPAFKTGMIAAGVCLLAAPWLLPGLFGVIRLIATIRIAGGNLTGDQSFLARFQEIFTAQGLIPIALIAVVSLVVRIKRLGWRDWLLVAYAALLIATPFLGYRQDFRYHGAPYVALIAVTSFLVIAWGRTLPNKVAWAMTAAALALPLAQAVGTIQTAKSDRVEDEATAWIEAHAPAGARVYLEPAFELRPPLPTYDAALAIWRGVSGLDAAQRKFEHGLSHYSAASNRVPLAMSEENMMLDRSNLRRWLLLGGGPPTDRPRFDIRLVRYGLFSIEDAFEALKKEPGLYIDRGGWETDDFAPLAEWRSPSGARFVRIFASPEVKPLLRP